MKRISMLAAAALCAALCRPLSAADAAADAAKDYEILEIARTGIAGLRRGSDGVVYL